MSHALQGFIILHVHAHTRTDAFTHIFTNDQKYLLVAMFSIFILIMNKAIIITVIFENQVD